jgi:hypothetical protein
VQATAQILVITVEMLALAVTTSNKRC